MTAASPKPLRTFVLTCPSARPGDIAVAQVMAYDHGEARSLAHQQAQGAQRMSRVFLDPGRSTCAITGQMQPQVISTRLKA